MYVNFSKKTATRTTVHTRISQIPVQQYSISNMQYIQDTAGTNPPVHSNPHPYPAITGTSMAREACNAFGLPFRPS